MSSLPFLFFLLDANFIHRLYLSLYAVCLQYMHNSTYTALLNRMGSIGLSFINLRPLTHYIQSLSLAEMLHLLLSFTIMFRISFHLNMLITSPTPSPGTAAQDFLLTFIPYLSTILMQKLTSIFILSSNSLVNFGTLHHLVHSPSYGLHSLKGRVSLQ